jgi:hypothetical protein
VFLSRPMGGWTIVDIHDSHKGSIGKCLELLVIIEQWLKFEQNRSLARCLLPQAGSIFPVIGGWLKRQLWTFAGPFLEIVRTQKARTVERAGAKECQPAPALLLTRIERDAVPVMRPSHGHKGYCCPLSPVLRWRARRDSNP